MSTLVQFLSANEITGANAGQRLEFAGKSRVGLSPRPGVAQFRRSACVRITIVNGSSGLAEKNERERKKSQPERLSFSSSFASCGHSRSFRHSGTTRTFRMTLAEGVLSADFPAVLVCAHPCHRESGRRFLSR